MTEAAPAPTPAEHSGRGRAIAAAVCLVLAAVLTVPASFAYWGQRTINDGQRYVDTVGPLVDSPEVQTAIATKVTDAIEEQVDVEALLTQAFAGVAKDRPRVSLLIGPITGAVNGLIRRRSRTSSRPTRSASSGWRSTRGRSSGSSSCWRVRTPVRCRCRAERSSSTCRWWSTR